MIRLHYRGATHRSVDAGETVYLYPNKVRLLTEKQFTALKNGPDADVLDECLLIEDSRVAKEEEDLVQQEVVEVAKAPAHTPAKGKSEKSRHRKYSH